MERVKALIENHKLKVEFLLHEEKSGLHTEDGESPGRDLNPRPTDYKSVALPG